MPVPEPTRPTLRPLFPSATVSRSAKGVGVLGPADGGLEPAVEDAVVGVDAGRLEAQGGLVLAPRPRLEHPALGADAVVVEVEEGVLLEGPLATACPAIQSQSDYPPACRARRGR